MAALRNWNSSIHNRDTAISVSISPGSRSGIIAISQASGIGSVYRASSIAVERLFGSDVECLERAFVQTLSRSLGLENLFVTIAMKEQSSVAYKQVIMEISQTLGS
jgi:hypothetical protein